MSIAPTLRTAPGQESLSTAHGNVAHLPRKSTNYVVDNEENLVNLNDRGLTAAFRSRRVLGRNARRGCSAGQDDPRNRPRNRLRGCAPRRPSSQTRSPRPPEWP